jgi:hypothetical protein
MNEAPPFLSKIEKQFYEILLLCDNVSKRTKDR